MATGILLIATGLLLYPLILWRLNRFVEEDRMMLAQEGEMLLAEPDVSDELRSVVSWMLDNAYNGWMAVRVALLLPIAAVLAVVGQRKAITDNKYYAQYRRLDRLFTRSIYAANPFFAAICLLEWLVIAFVVLIIGRSRLVLQRIETIMIEKSARGLRV